MTIWQSIWLGVIQGLTEFLPISSTAHLRVIPAILGWDDPGGPFTAVIQLGTLGAVLLFFWRDIVRISLAVFEGIKTSNPFMTLDARMGWMIVVGTIPIVIAGFTLRHQIETNFRSLYVISASLVGLAIVLWIAELHVTCRMKLNYQPRQLKELSWLDAIVVGLAQSLALVPGSSRSGVTITAGLFLGMTRETSARFSFLLSLPSVFAAGIFELFRNWNDLLSTDVGAIKLIVATLVSGAVGYATIAGLLGYLKRSTTHVFIVYRLGLGLILIGLLMLGYLQPT